MISVIARVKVQAGNEDTFRAEAARMVEHVRANEPDTTIYVCLQSTSDPTAFSFYEEYVSNDALAAHGGSDAIQAFFGAVGPMLDGAPSIETFTETDAKR
jgi:quinol monooxygenase YgiN